MAIKIEPSSEQVAGPYPKWRDFCNLSNQFNQRKKRKKRYLVIPILGRSARTFDKEKMKSILFCIVAVLAAAGCRTVYEAEVPMDKLPLPPDSLHEFLKTPQQGLYALPDVAPYHADYFFRNEIGRASCRERV